MAEGGVNKSGGESVPSQDNPPTTGVAAIKEIVESRKAADAENADEEKQPQSQRGMGRRRFLGVIGIGGAAVATGGIAWWNKLIPWGHSNQNQPDAVADSSTPDPETKNQITAKDRQVRDLLEETRLLIKGPYQGQLSEQKEKYLDKEGKNLWQRLKENGYRVRAFKELSHTEKENPRFNFTEMVTDDGAVVERLNAELIYKEDGSLVRADISGRIGPQKVEGIDKRTKMMDVQTSTGSILPSVVIHEQALKDSVMAVFNLPDDAIWTENRNPNKKNSSVWDVHGVDAKGRDIDFRIDSTGNFEYSAAKDAKG